MVWPQTPLPVLVELQLAGAWVDITDDVRLDDRISISRGRADEAGKVDTTKCRLKLNNRHGYYSPRNAVGPYYGTIGRNTPLRVSVLADAPRMVMLPQPPGSVGASTPDTGALDTTTDIDIRFDACLTNWVTRGVQTSVELCGKATTAGNQRSWALMVRNGRLRLEWSADGTAVREVESTAVLPVPASSRLAVRATLDADNGSGQHVVTFYTASSISGPWVQLGAAVTTAGTTSIYNSTSALWVGTAVVGVDATPCRGEIYGCQIRSSIGGATVAHFEPGVQAEGATGWTDIVGRTWSVTGAQITNRRTRFIGEVSEWPGRWDVSGADKWVPIEAAGVMRRLGQGASPLHTATYRALLDVEAAAPPVAYWPMDDGQDATQAGSALPSGAAMTATGSIKLGQEGGARGGAGSGAGTGDAAGVLTGPGTGSTGKDLINFWIEIPEECTDGIGVQILTPGSVYTRNLVWVQGTAQTDPGIPDGHLALEVRRAQNDGGGGWEMFDYDLRGTGPHMVSLYIYESGGVRYFRGYLDGVRYFVLGVADHASAISQIRVGTIRPWYDEIATPHTMGAVAGIVGDLSIQAIPPSWVLANTDDEVYRLFQAGIAHAGETAAARIARLCHESAVPVSIGASAATAPNVGYQTPLTFLELLAEAADADGGIQGELRDRELGIAFRDHETLLSQPVAMRIPYGHLAPDLEPTEDDATVRNDVTASRPGGSSARRTVDTGPLSTQPPPDGVGRYDEAITVNVAQDNMLADAAGWRAHLGTWDEARYPVIRLDLAATPDLATIASLVDLGDRAQVYGLPADMPPEDIDVLLQGYGETLGAYDWDLAFNCTPARPWDGAVVDDEVYGRADTDGCALAQPAAAADTQIWAYTPAPNPTWVSGNVVLNANSSFEADTAGWSATGGTMARINTLAVDGSWSLQLTPDGVAQYPALQYQLTPIEAGATYRISAWMRCTTTRNLSLNINWFTSTSAYLPPTGSINVPVVGGVWTYASGQLVAPAGAAYAQISPTVPNYPAVGDRMTVDDIRLATTDGRGLDVVLNANPSFDANLDGWAGVGGTLARVNTQQRVGPYSAQLTPDGVSQYPSIQSAKIAIEAGRTYRASAWLRCATARTIDLNVNWHRVDGGYVDTSSISIAVAAGTWTSFSGLVTAPATAQLAVLAPTVANYPPVGDVLWADDVRLSIPGDPAAEYPFDIWCGGEVMTVTGVADQTSPQLLTVTRSVNGISKSHTAGTDIRRHKPSIATY